MKKIVSFACAAIVAVPAFSQFTTGGSSSSTFNSDPISDYNQLGIYYNNSNFNYTYDGDSEDDYVPTMNGFAVKYLHGFSVSKKLPMFVETGLNFNMNFGTLSDEDDDEYDYRYQYAALAVPVNFAYKFSINDNIAIKPFIGLNFKFNLLARERLNVTDSDWREYLEDKDLLKEYEEWYSFYSKDDMGDKDYTWNRFQMGWHIGVDFSFNKFIVGINYGTDFIPAWKYKKNKVSTQTLNVGVGLYF